MLYQMQVFEQKKNLLKFSWRRKMKNLQKHAIASAKFLVQSVPKFFHRTSRHRIRILVSCRSLFYVDVLLDCVENQKPFLRCSITYIFYFFSSEPLMLTEDMMSNNNKVNAAILENKKNLFVKKASRK